jgi:hypothetical protein
MDRPGKDRERKREKWYITGHSDTEIAEVIE